MKARGPDRRPRDRLADKLRAGRWQAVRRGQCGGVPQDSEDCEMRETRGDSPQAFFKSAISDSNFLFQTHSVTFYRAATNTHQSTHVHVKMNASQ